MSPWWWLLLGMFAGGAIGLAVGLQVTRRVWRTTRRLTARARGRDQLAELGHLAAGLAHEIKNPLSTIHINLKLLAEDLARYGDEGHSRWLRRLQSVQGEAERLKDILDDFLRYAGKVELTLAVADLRKLVEELSDFFAPQAESARVVMRLSLPEREVRGNVDSNLIKQALLNLMINAVQAMGEGGELLIKLSPLRGRAVIEVIDTGPGIPADQLPKIFQAYFSTKKRGTGLGLPTTRRIIHEHGGTIQVESEQGKGTRFIITLPLARQ